MQIYDTPMSGQHKGVQRNGGMIVDVVKDKNNKGQYIYIYIYTHTYTCIYIYIYIQIIYYSYDSYHGPPSGSWRAAARRWAPHRWPGLAETSRNYYM